MGFWIGLALGSLEAVIAIFVFKPWTPDAAPAVGIALGNILWLNILVVIKGMKWLVKQWKESD